MNGNDFIIFKHGCGNDSVYTMEKNNIHKFSQESEEKMQKHCENHTFYHVEVEFIGDSSNIYEYKESEDELPNGSGPPISDSADSKAETEVHSENDEINPKMFKLKRATLLEWNFTKNGKEEIWYDKPQEITLKKGAQENQLTLKFFQFQRDDLKRKTTILRKVNPSDCNFMPIGNQNIFLHWGMFVENFDSSILKTLNETDDEVIIRRSHLYSEKIPEPARIGRDVSSENRTETIREKRVGFGSRLIHLIDFHDVPDSKSRALSLKV